ncbi:MAG TPA: sulfatase-like hydrolase/transferase, partial [Thermoanaerobaculia bacterium]|nr:sulfatase-like hydrolase/transferase [Thermoanaerobaculia bacterium]
TPPSHFSIMTGLRDGLATDDDRVENSVAYQLSRVGYHTFATVANSLLTPPQMPTFRAFKDFREIGDISKGTFFDSVGDLTDVDFRLRLFEVPPTPRNRVKAFFHADEMLPVFLQQIEKTEPPYFGFVNLLDPHEPYVPDLATYRPERSLPPNFSGDIFQRPLTAEQTNPDSIKDPERRAYVKKKIAEAGAPWLTSFDLTPQELAIYHNRYNAEARHADGVLKEFFAALDRDHVLDNTVVIITSDHGESFGEDDLVTHMFHDRGDPESTHHVPLVVVFPPSLNVKTGLVDRRVSIANIAPMIYELAGLDRTPLETRYKDYPPSLLRAVGISPLATVSQIVLPAPAKQDHSAAETERRKAMQSLGYVH